MEKRQLQEELKDLSVGWISLAWINRSFDSLKLSFMLLVSDESLPKLNGDFAFYILGFGSRSFGRSCQHGNSNKESRSICKSPLAGAEVKKSWRQWEMRVPTQYLSGSSQQDGVHIATLLSVLDVNLGSSFNLSKPDCFHAECLDLNYSGIQDTLVMAKPWQEAFKIHTQIERDVTDD